jgi:predicted hydrocarbon binding protein
MGEQVVKMGITSIFKKMLIGRAFTTEKGRIKMFGEMDWTLYPSRGLAHFFQTIGEKLGEDYLYNLSYKNGKFNGKDMVKAMKLKLEGGWITQKAITSLLDFLGYGKIEFIRLKTGPGNHHHFIIHSSENPIVEHAIKMYGKKEMACTYWRGLLAGHGEVELGIKGSNLMEKKCISEGAERCIFESRR